MKVFSFSIQDLIPVFSGLETRLVIGVCSWESIWRKLIYPIDFSSLFRYFLISLCLLTASLWICHRKFYFILAHYFWVDVERTHAWCILHIHANCNRHCIKENLENQRSFSFFLQVAHTIIHSIFLRAQSRPRSLAMRTCNDSKRIIFNLRYALKTWAVLHRCTGSRWSLKVNQTCASTCLTVNLSKSLVVRSFFSVYNLIWFLSL